MSDFWSKALGGAPAPAPRTVPAPSTDQPWWQTSFVPTPQPQQQAAQQFDQAITEPSLTPRQATSARSTATCPNCGSGNYTKGDSAGSMTRCFECGYNPRFDQMAFAATGGTPSTATRQAASTSTGFHPTQIVAKVGI